MQGDANKYVLLETTTSRLFLGFYIGVVFICPAKLIFTQYDQLGTGFMFAQNIQQWSHLAQINNINPSQSTHFLYFLWQTTGLYPWLRLLELNTSFALPVRVRN